MTEAARCPRARLGDRVPWLLDPALGVCVVGSGALAQACARHGLEPPQTADLDLAWAPDPAAGEKLLERHGVARQTTAANRARGTLAFMLGGERVEITSFRAGSAAMGLEQRILTDLRHRDMTVGALAWWLEPDRILDPLGGLADWREHRIVPAGEPAARIAEHPVRWLRYYRRAHQWGFRLEPSITALAPAPEILARIPPEVLAAEMRAALLSCASPGRFLMALHQAGLLIEVMPELAPLFDGRPAGPVQHHPEISLARHMILCLEWITERTLGMSDSDRVTAAVVVLCHDLGKGLTDAPSFPAHKGHERAGLPLVKSLLSRLPGLADRQTRRLAELVCRLHLDVRRLAEMRDGTLARLYERHLRPRELRLDLFALAVGADVGGRLGRAEQGDAIAAEVETALTRLRRICEEVDAAALAERAGGDVERLRALLHQARAQAISRSFRTESPQGE